MTAKGREGADGPPAGAGDAPTSAGGRKAPRGGPRRPPPPTDGRHEAVRTCVVSRTAAPREDLVRLVASPEGEVVLDYRGRLPGRGVWILPSPTVLRQLAKQKGKVERDLEARLDVVALEAALREAVAQGVREGLSMGAAAGALVLGRDVLEKALLEERVDLVALASDCAPRTSRALEDAAGGLATFVTVPLTATEIGRLVGRGLVAAVGVPDGGVTGWLRRQLRRLAVLG